MPLDKIHGTLYQAALLGTFPLSGIPSKVRCTCYE
jgi:hypothetical protein